MLYVPHLELALNVYKILTVLLILRNHLVIQAVILARFVLVFPIAHISLLGLMFAIQLRAALNAHKILTVVMILQNPHVIWAVISAKSAQIPLIAHIFQQAKIFVFPCLDAANVTQHQIAQVV